MSSAWNQRPHGGSLLGDKATIAGEGTQSDGTGSEQQGLAKTVSPQVLLIPHECSPQMGEGIRVQGTKRMDPNRFLVTWLLTRNQPSRTEEGGSHACSFLGPRSP